MKDHRRHHWTALLTLLALLTSALALPLRAPTAVAAARTLNSVTLAGDLGHAIPTCNDWQQNCAAAHLTNIGNGVWRGEFSLPAGSWQYKLVINDDWSESYAGNHTANGNTTLNLNAPTSVRFYYDDKTHAVLDNVMDKVAVAAGTLQSKLGCGDWQPSCVSTLLTDVDGDGIYALETTDLPLGSYEFKVALNEKWDTAYPANNMSFSVTTLGQKVRITWDSRNHDVQVVAGHAHDNNVEWDGLRHDSRDALYRSPGGAVPAGTPVKIRFRTFHDDVTAVKLRVYDLNAGGQTILPMTIAAGDASCYQAGLESQTCDYWQATLPNATPNNLWYRFIVQDGTSTAYYADNTGALDGGLGATSANAIDNSYALMVYQPGFTAPAWAKNAVIYQIFPDRFRNGRKDNDPKTGDLRYDDPALSLPWGTKPEGYCRNYAGATTASCPWRFGAPPGAPADQREQPRGRDYMGGDLRGVDQQLDYLKSLGVNTIYFNPIFDAGSNHSYDTQDYFKVDPYFGSQKDWENLTKHAKELGMRIILDGVFNHMSSDSPFFDRYHHYDTLGACESLASPWRGWFTFHDVAAGTGTCVGAAGASSATYDGWFGFDSIPVLKKSNPAVQQYFITQPNSVSKTWLNAGAAAWRLDVMGDSSFPGGYWESFRTTVKATKPDALIVGELWQKDSTLLRFLRGDRADATMNYRLRDAVLGLLAPQSFDSKGFADSGRSISPSEFAARLSSIREDYPDAAFYSLMNLLDSHDTERLLWTLTPGSATTADKELNAANLAAGKQRQRLAALLQFTMPGAPTVYYGDEVGLTGADDPDDRRAYPWADLGGTPDTALFAHYQKLAQLRQQNPALTAGDFQILLANDAKNVVAYGRKTASQAAVVIVNRGDSAQSGQIPVAGYLPNGVKLNAAYVVGSGAASTVTVTNGQIDGSIGAKSAVILLSGNVDLQPPSAPAGLRVTSEGNGAVGLAWNAVGSAAGYNVYRSPVSGGGWVKANGGIVSGTSFDDTGLKNARTYYYAVRALDAAGNESGSSNEVSAVPFAPIGWAGHLWPPSLEITISATESQRVYAQVWADGLTNAAGQGAGVLAEFGYGASGSNPSGWSWAPMAYNADVGNNDEYRIDITPAQVGSFDYLARFSTDLGRHWIYAYTDDGARGTLAVNSSGDTTAPATPSGLKVDAASPDGIKLSWQPMSGDPTLYGYEVRRAAASGGPYTTLALITASSYIDQDVVQGATYYYVVRAVDQSYNRSGDSAEVAATADLRTVTLVFNVTVPSGTDGTSRSVYIAGFLDRLDGGLPQWNPGGVSLTRVDATHWTITLTGKEATQIDYKYTLGDWDHVEKDGACGEIANRQLTLTYGATGTQSVDDTVENWRNVAPCVN